MGLEEKLNSIFQELGVVETYRKYSVSTGTLYSWKKKHTTAKEDGLK
jgi:putative transposase